jgi:hypothetical protein
VTSPSTFDPGENTWQPHSELIRDPNFVPFQGNDGKVGRSVGARADWTEMDFPPLGDSKGEHKTDCGVWGGRTTRLEKEEVAKFVIFLGLLLVYLMY